MIKTEFIKLYEELNTLNEEVLTEGRYDDFSKIPAEDLLTKCIIDGKPGPINDNDHSKDGVVSFYVALNEIIKIIKGMNDENKAKFTLDWIAIGSIKDLIGTTTTVANKPRPRSNSLMRDTNYSIAVEAAEMELDRVIQQVGSDETELSSLQKLPILLKSNIIMCCRPSTALEEANNKDNEMANIAVYLGGVGKLAPYYSEIQQAFKQIKKAYEGSFLSKVAAKLFKREELETDELDTLNEVFNYKEEDILSDEEVKELTDKIAALKPQEEKASADWRAIRNKLKADNVAFMRGDKNPEYNKALAAYRNIRDQIGPLESKLKKHNEAVKYKSAEGQLATEEDGDRILGYEGDVEVEDLEVEVYREESEYESGGDSMRDSIIYTTVPAQSGYITRGTVSVEVTKEHVAEFLGKEIEEVTIRDIMDLDEKAFTEHLATYDEVIDRAIKEAEEAVESGDYDYDDVSWDEDDDGRG